jgi:predicted RNase H-like HicB family nuclease
MTYRVAAEWDETGWWALTSPDVSGAVSQCRRLDQAAGDMAEAITLMTGQDVSRADIEVAWHVPGEAGTAAQRAYELRVKADRLAAEAMTESKRAVGDLREAGFSYRDIGTVTGMSYQRAQQLDKEHSRH